MGQAMDLATQRADIGFDQLDYVNLHGTGTRSNDSIEAKLCAELLPPRTACSSTKGWTGHTLGAAGICEALLTIDAINTQTIPGNINTLEPDPLMANRLVMENTRSFAVRYAMSNSFGFGGHNATIAATKFTGYASRPI